MKSSSTIRQFISRSPLGKLYRLRHRFRNPQSVFIQAYERNIWNSNESVSGTGSTIEQTEKLREALPKLLVELHVTRMLDAPCGDYHWMSQTRLPLERYVGADIVPQLIQQNIEKYGSEGRQFIVRNIIEDELPLVDLILCRDLFIHLRFKDIFRAIENFKKSGSKYLLTTTFPTRTNKDLEFTGGFRPVNLQAAPFNFPLPLKLINEDCTEMEGLYSDKSLGLWLL
ncbi:MAG TPA: hypothetical protein VF528_12370 [Pyrinomonadaceae bacterium]|jgi:hypothetical protein